MIKTKILYTSDVLTGDGTGVGTGVGSTVGIFSTVRYKNEESIANFKNNRNKGILSHRQPKRLQNCSKKDHPEALQSQAASKIEVRRCRNDV